MLSESTFIKSDLFSYVQTFDFAFAFYLEKVKVVIKELLKSNSLEHNLHQPQPTCLAKEVAPWLIRLGVQVVVWSRAAAGSWWGAEPFPAACNTSAVAMSLLPRVPALLDVPSACPNPQECFSAEPPSAGTAGTTPHPAACQAPSKGTVSLQIEPQISI